MKIEFHKVPETIAIIREWYTPEELTLVWRELDVLCSPFILKRPEITGSATSSEDGGPTKRGHGLFLDQFYGEFRDSSNILRLNQKIFCAEFIKRLMDEDPAFTYFKISTIDNTLVNYYENDDSYNMHFDYSLYTSNIVLWREPRQFDGGKFLLTEKELDFDVKSNDMVIFPGYMLHGVTKLSMHDQHVEWKSGRYSIANFISYRN